MAENGEGTADVIFGHFLFYDDLQIRGRKVKHGGMGMVQDFLGKVKGNGVEKQDLSGKSGVGIFHRWKMPGNIFLAGGRGRLDEKIPHQ